jgi:hypothetical protein
MRIEDQGFSAKVELPCKIFCGPDSMLEVSGTALNINTGSLQLRLGAPPSGAWHPAVGERVRLELELPVKVMNAKAKCMSLRATIAGVKELPDGTQRLELRFRKASFKDMMEDRLARPAKAAVVKWKM